MDFAKLLEDRRKVTSSVTSLGRSEAIGHAKHGITGLKLNQTVAKQIEYYYSNTQW